PTGSCKSTPSSSANPSIGSVAWDLFRADELKSENYLKEAETLNPISPSIYLTRALLYRRQKDERSFREAVGAAASRFSDKLHLRSDIQAILNA
ncbi:hypothetical protein, partial [Roseomonas mucosa]|uniref:hypothetical protein n=1 Tax=Roseomonas mucosa TaxID=207340 RepID=UPI0028CCF178